MAYATTTALNAETAARRAADTAETASRGTADAALDARVAALEAAVRALQTPVIVPTLKVVPVSSIAALLSTLADDTVDVIDVADGTYTVPVANGGDPGALRIDARFAARTRPVTVRAHTDGGVTLSGGGAAGWEGIWLLDGCHDQAWRGFRLANATVTQGGAIVFGQSGSLRPAGVRNIALQGWTVEESVKSGSALSQLGDHAVYVSSSTTPSTGISIDGLTVNSTLPDGIDSALHFYVQPALGVGPQGFAVTRLRVLGTDQAIVFWDGSLGGVSVSDSVITGARRFAVRYEMGGLVTLDRVTSTGSGSQGFYSSLGTNPPGVTLDACSLS